MNAFKLTTITMACAACLGLTACGQLGYNAAAAGSNNTQSTQQQQLAALDALSSLAGEIDLHFDLVEDVDAFVLPFVLPPAFVDGSTTLPKFPRFARVSGIGDLGILASANGSSLFPPIRYMNAAAVFSDDTTEGQNCVQAANDALNNKLQMEIKGQGYIVQIATWCPTGAMCAQPQAVNGSTAEGEADAVASLAPSMLTTPPTPAPWTVPQFTVLYRTIDFCMAADPIVPIPVPVATPL